VDVAVEYSVAALGAIAVVEGQGDDILHVLRVLEGLDGCVEVVLVRQVDALEDGALRIQQVAVVVPAAHAILRQHAVGTGARPLPATPEQAELLAAPVALGTDVGAWEGKGGLFEGLGRLCVGGKKRPLGCFSPLPARRGSA